MEFDPKIAMAFAIVQVAIGALCAWLYWKFLSTYH